MKKIAIILAAGKGVRMNSPLPKVSHMVFGKPMITRVLEAVSKLGLDRIFVVVGYKADIVREECAGFDVEFVEQSQQLGTGHAVMQVEPRMKEEAVILVLNGDVPLISSGTLKKLIEHHTAHSASATVLTASISDPRSYGRIIRSPGGEVLKIVEQKDATDEERAVTEINTGTYCFASKKLFEALNRIRPDNVQKEYYLTDVIRVIREKGGGVHAFKAQDPREVLGVNTIEELKELEERHDIIK